MTEMPVPTSATTQRPTKITAAFFANSHGHAVRLAADADNLSYAIHDVRALPQVSGDFFEVKDGTPVFLPKDLKVEKQRSIEQLNKKLQRALEADFPIFSTYGSEAFWFVRRFQRMAGEAGLSSDDYSRKMLRIAIKEHNKSSLSFYDAMVAGGVKIYHIVAPPRFSGGEERLWKLYDNHMVELLDDIGVDIIDVRPSVCDAQGLLKPEFQPAANSDDVHGGIPWGKVVLDAVLERVS